MIIYYPTYYLVPVAVVRSLDENEEYMRCNMESNYLSNTYVDTNQDIFEEIDEEYIRDSIRHVQIDNI